MASLNPATSISLAAASDRGAFAVAVASAVSRWGSYWESSRERPVDDRTAQIAVIPRAAWRTGKVDHCGPSRREVERLWLRLPNAFHQKRGPLVPRGSNLSLGALV